jgi:AraC-like DNA-binding protein
MPNMPFSFNAYSAPLAFGFAQAWIYAAVFVLRAWRNERMSDYLFALLLFFLSFEIWEYMLGFGGISVLWTELEFFPRNFSYLVPPLCYFYLKSQLDQDFRFRRKDGLHALPFLLHFVYHVLIYLQGPKFVEDWKRTVHFPWGIQLIEEFGIYVLQAVYFYLAYRLYSDYRRWAPSQFSDPESISFVWYRNFIWAFWLTSIFSALVSVVDIWLALDFWHDWWDELFEVGLIYYLCIAGYAQWQTRKLYFKTQAPEDQVPAQMRSEKVEEAELQLWRQKLTSLMETERPFLDPELNLSDLAKRLNTNVSILSAVVNGAFGKNFNDYVNEYRVEAVKHLLKDPQSQHLSLLGIGLECGFNSKSTFNRAFKKATGLSPREFLSGVS